MPPESKRIYPEPPITQAFLFCPLEFIEFAFAPRILLAARAQQMLPAYKPHRFLCCLDLHARAAIH